MGFFSDLGKGLSSVIKAPFEGIGAAVAGIGQGIGSIIHGSQQQNGAAYAGERAQGCQGNDPMRAYQLYQMQQAMAFHRGFYAGAYSMAMMRPGTCGA